MIDYWFVVCCDVDIGIESLYVYFIGYVYDVYDYDDMLVGFIEQGVQCFQCYCLLYISVLGCVILIELGVMYDGYVFEVGGFMYGMLYLLQVWVECVVCWFDLLGFGSVEVMFGYMFVDDCGFVDVIWNVFFVIYDNEGWFVCDQMFDCLLMWFGSQLGGLFVLESVVVLFVIVCVCDLLYVYMDGNFGFDEFVSVVGIDWFWLMWMFQCVFGMLLYVYFVCLWLCVVCKLFVVGCMFVQVVVDVGFVDQSYFGCWFCCVYWIMLVVYW